MCTLPEGGPQCAGYSPPPSAPELLLPASPTPGQFDRSSVWSTARLLPAASAFASCATAAPERLLLPASRSSCRCWHVCWCQRQLLPWFWVSDFRHWSVRPVQDKSSTCRLGWLPAAAASCCTAACTQQQASPGVRYFQYSSTLKSCALTINSDSKCLLAEV